jgi:hypothetical protein
MAKARVRKLLAEAEAQLRKLDGAAALNLFEQAALLVHSSEVETGIVLAHLQAGQFQRALAFCAHASGAHLEESAPTLLYAHLLKISGQAAYAEKLMSEYRLRFGAEDTKNMNLRLSPYFDAFGLPNDAKMLGSGLRVPLSSSSGERIAIPTVLIPTGVKNFWVRYGNGFLLRAVLEVMTTGASLALIKVEKPLANLIARPITVAGKSPFPGSLAFGLYFQQQLPLSWPTLWTAFVGEPIANQVGRRMVDVPTTETSKLLGFGGAVFDQGGAAIGFVAPLKAGSKTGKSQLIPLTELGLIPANLVDGRVRDKFAADQIYQLGLNNLVQVIGSA